MTDQAQALRDLCKAPNPLDYRRLWLDLKAELEAQADKCVGNQIHGYRPTLAAIEAKAKLDHMLQMETLQR